jgi:ligand-binding sensor domain-containing protein
MSALGRSHYFFPRRFFLWLPFFAVFELIASGSALQYGLRVWQTDEGLPHNYVQAIAQTQQGDLWIGTLNGLARFDGIRFTVYEPGNTPSMKNARINALLSTRDGSLWIGGGSGMLLQWKEGRFISHGESAALGSNPVLTIFESRDGSIWIGTRDGALQFTNGQFKKINRDAVMSRTVRQFCEDRQGQLWLATVDGLACFRDGVFLTNYTSASGLPSPVVRAVAEDHEGNIWIGSMGGLSKLTDGVLKNYSVTDGLTDNAVSALGVDHQDQLWIGTFNGLCRMVDGNLLTEWSADHVPFDSVYTFFEDREKNFWFGSRDGLCRLNPKQFFTYTQQHGLSRNNVISVLESRAGDIWIGTWGGGANRMRDGKVTAYIADKPVFGDLVLSVFEDHDGNMWFGTDYQGGLFKFRDGQITHYGANAGLVKDAIRVIYEDRQKNLWVGSSSALHRFDNGRFVAFTQKDGLASSNIRALCEDHDGILWIGTTEGLSQFKDGRFNSHPELAGEAIYAIYEDAEHSLWVGTHQRGLIRFAGGKVAAFTRKDGLFSDQIFEILEDDDGWLWMSSLNGIFRVDKKQLDDLARGSVKSVTCISYGRSDGMDSATCVGTAKPAGWKSRDGRLWFPTTKGVVVTDPRLGRKANDQPPPIVLERVVANKRSIPIQAARFAVEGSGEDAAPLNLDAETLNIEPGRGELEFEFSALSYCAPEKNRFKYKLEGVDSEWIETGTRHSAHYNNILPGSYRFRVIGCNNDGVWNDRGASVIVNLLPHFWQTWWFKIATAFSGIVVVVGVYRIRETQQRQIERLRLRLAADLHDEVGSNLGSISLLSRMMGGAENLSLDQKGDLSLINRVSKETANAIRDIVWFTNPQFDTLHDLVKRMEDVANTLLSGAERNFSSRIEQPDRKLSLEFRQNVFLMFKETLANIIKHSQAAHVEVEVSQQENTWQMRITDDGMGFDLEKTERGNGLPNLQRRALQMRGELKIRTQPGHGTTILFSAPLEKTGRWLSR